MIRMDLHTHSTFCDGKNTPEEMVQAAIAKGLTCIGFSSHGYAPYDLDCCMPEADIPAYQTEILRLREVYRGQIRILLGIEQDCLSDTPTAGYDYVIGSAHYVRCGGEYACVDEGTASFDAAAERFFGGDYYAFAAAYFALEAEVVARTNADIIGHFDLFSKFNGGGCRFDEDDPRYVRAWQDAAARLLETGRPFEINTGALARGYRAVPYPAPPILRWLGAHGARFLLAGDSHSTAGVAFDFDRWEAFARAEGLKLITDWD